MNLLTKNLKMIFNLFIFSSYFSFHRIKTYSIEFLRPVCLYIFCNPQIIPDSKTIWTNLLALSKNSTEANDLICEIITWSKVREEEEKN